jgi:membrane protein YqaA with SNARE-associated domain
MQELPRFNLLPLASSVLVTDFTSLISAYGVWLIGGMIALESAGIPVPGETVLVAASIYAGTTHDLNIASVIAAGIVGGTVGNVIAFAIGRVYGYRLLRQYGGYLQLTIPASRSANISFCATAAKLCLSRASFRCCAAWPAFWPGPTICRGQAL